MFYLYSRRKARFQTKNDCSMFIFHQFIEFKPTEGVTCNKPPSGIQQYLLITLDKLVLRFPLAPMGVLATWSAHARPSARPPIDTSGNFTAHVSAESSSNISPNPSEVISEVSEP